MAVSGMLGADTPQWLQEWWADRQLQQQKQNIAQGGKAIFDSLKPTSSTSVFSGDSEGGGTVDPTPINFDALNPEELINVLNTGFTNTTHRNIMAGVSHLIPLGKQLVTIGSTVNKKGAYDKIQEKLKDPELPWPVRTELESSLIKSPMSNILSGNVRGAIEAGKNLGSGLFDGILNSVKGLFSWGDDEIGYTQQERRGMGDLVEATTQPPSTWRNPDNPLANIQKITALALADKDPLNLKMPTRMERDIKSGKRDIDGVLKDWAKRPNEEIKSGHLLFPTSSFVPVNTGGLFYAPEGQDWMNPPVDPNWSSLAPQSVSVEDLAPVTPINDVTLADIYEGEDLLNRQLNEVNALNTNTDIDDMNMGEGWGGFGGWT